MDEYQDPIARHAARAVRSAAEALGMEPLAFSRRLGDGEIASLVRLLNAAATHVSTPGLRHRIEDLLSNVTDGRMPMFEKPGSQLDWALGKFRQRGGDAAKHAPGDDDEDDDGN